MAEAEKQKQGDDRRQPERQADAGQPQRLARRRAGVRRDLRAKGAVRVGNMDLSEGAMAAATAEGIPPAARR